MTAMVGVVLGVSANVIFGVQPLYWKLLEDFDSYQVTMHRLVWSLPVIGIALVARHDLKTYFEVMQQKEMIAAYFVTALLMAVNFFLSLWAVTAGYVLQMSLGFFMNPLMTVLLGVVFLRETMTHIQFCAIALATIGVLVVTIGEGEFPWVALAVGLDNAVFTLLRKIAPLNGLVATSMEITMMFIPALIYLLCCEAMGTGEFGHSGFTADLLMIGAGPWSVIPLVLLSLSIDHISLVVLGVIQFISPTLSTLLGLFVFGEIPSQSLVIGFTCVVLALIIFTYASAVAPSPEEKTLLLPQKHPIQEKKV
ncbi:membrane protein [Thraustotheca clavata]|uniref:Membrane protein n=1 Tax=Thraustotheca clavata TaxID=74557 RepID=A0A1V9Z6G6_9STRA|nr:membrane protein [Thraustotheca clavata]